MVSADSVEDMKLNSYFKYNKLIKNEPPTLTLCPYNLSSTSLYPEYPSSPSPADFSTTQPESTFESDGFNAICGLPSPDSAVDLTSQVANYTFAAPVRTVNPKDLKKLYTDTAPTGPNIDALFQVGEASSVSNTPSPVADAIFSSNNSPGHLFGEHSHLSSREPSTEIQFASSPEPLAELQFPTQDQMPPQLQPTEDDQWYPHDTPDAVFVPHTPPISEPTKVYISPDKTKTRAETQIKVILTLDPVDARFEYISFPRKTLAKPKFLHTPQEKKEAEQKGKPIHMDVMLVCSTAIEDPAKRETALRRARGDEPIPRRNLEQTLGDIEKDDPAHPQNGGEVLICAGCQERERKRYDRKKKKSDDESEWVSYEAERVIIINEKEYKKWKEVDSSISEQVSSRARQVEFAMRIACYCRHQEEKTPVGYRVIFTFKDDVGTLITQHVSDIFQITDDHKNKDSPHEAMQQMQHTPYIAQHPYGSMTPIMIPSYTQYIDPYAMATFSQPQTPSVSGFSSSMSPVEAHFSQPTTPTVIPLPVRQNFQSNNFSTPPHFSNPSNPMTSITAPQFPRPIPPPRYDAPLPSPTAPLAQETHLHRPQSMDNFGYAWYYHNQQNQQFQSQGFSSAPQSTASTPINLSRPASPTWEQGPQHKKHQQSTFHL